MDTNVDLAGLLDVIRDSISAHMPGLSAVEFHRDDRRHVTSPACLLELEDFEPFNDAGDTFTEQLQLRANFAARLIFGFRGDRVRLQIRRAALTLAHHIHQQRWGYAGMGPAEISSIAPDYFSPELDHTHVWVVHWSQTMFVGDTVWKNNGIIPREVLSSWEPRTGPDHIDDYEAMT